MKRTSPLVLAVVLVGAVAPCVGLAKAPLPALPLAVSNNAVAVLRLGDGERLYSLLGIGATKRWDAISSRAFELRLGEEPLAWRELPPVPGERGRIAGSAVGLGGRLYLFGGYTVAADGTEVSTPNVDVWDPAAARWSRAPDMPVPVDDAVVAPFAGRWIVLVSGWSQKGNVANVQLFDTATGTWSQATPFPGTPVFGHGGAIVGSTLVVCGGATVAPAHVTPKYRATSDCYRGDLDARDPRAIAWAPLAPHPAVALYRAAAGATLDGRRIVFAGGTRNPYNYDGLGYDGVPSEPVDSLVAFEPASGRWSVLGTSAAPTMDHRGLVVVGDRLVRLGGMTKGQRVTAAVGVDPLPR